jgi:hypothetical protein
MSRIFRIGVWTTVCSLLLVSGSAQVQKSEVGAQLTQLNKNGGFVAPRESFAGSGSGFTYNLTPGIGFEAETRYLPDTSKGKIGPVFVERVGLRKPAFGLFANARARLQQGQIPAGVWNPGRQLCSHFVSYRPRSHFALDMAQMTNEGGKYGLGEGDAGREFQTVARPPEGGGQIANKVLPASNDLAEDIAVSSAELPRLLEAGDRVSVVLTSGHAFRGKVLAVGGSDVALQVKASQTPDVFGLARQPIPYVRLARISVATLKGNKRTKLPVILCATLGTLAFVAAGATEELKSTYLPVAAGFTAGLAIGGYFLGKKLDEEVVTYVIRNK